jgi:hypothetical protein
VRIPKSVLPELNELAQGRPFSPPGVVDPYERELLSLTPAEQGLIHLETSGGDRVVIV